MTEDRRQTEDGVTDKASTREACPSKIVKHEKFKALKVVTKSNFFWYLVFKAYNENHSSEKLNGGSQFVISIKIQTNI